MRRIILFAGMLLLSVVVLNCTSNKSGLPEIGTLGEELRPLVAVSMENNKIPRTLNEDGSIRWIAEPYDWTEGFWPGVCWMLYDYTGNEEWKQAAASSQKIYEDHKDLTTDHDLGFIFNNSYGKGYKITGNKEYKQVLLDAAESLITRFNENVGCIQSWDVADNWQATRGWKFPVIVDNLMNLELLFEATKLTGKEKYAQIAIQHANTTMRNHFRKDGSSYHVVDYDPQTGAVRSKETAQGYADESAWARGQAWALYGYTMCYRYTKDEKYLQLAEKIANFILTHPNYPKNGVPYWDFNAPKIPDEPRDASAGAIMASAWIELDEYSDNNYLDEAKKVLTTLSSERFLNIDGQHFLLNHSVGSIPHGNEIDVPLVYADYYYIEALIRMENSNKK